MSEATTPKSLSHNADVNARDIMCSKVVSVGFGTTARELERILIDSEVSGVAVNDNSGKIVGICSWRDVMRAFAENNEDEPHRPHDFFRCIDPRTMDTSREVEVAIDDAVTASDVMNTELLMVTEETGLKDIARKMTEHHVHRLLVADKKGQVVGLVSTMDIMNALGQ